MVLFPFARKARRRFGVVPSPSPSSCVQVKKQDEGKDNAKPRKGGERPPPTKAKKRRRTSTSPTKAKKRRGTKKTLEKTSIAGPPHEEKTSTAGLAHEEKTSTVGPPTKTSAAGPSMDHASSNRSGAPEQFFHNRWVSALLKDDGGLLISLGEETFSSSPEPSFRGGTSGAGSETAVGRGGSETGTVGRGGSTQLPKRGPADEEDPRAYFLSRALLPKIAAPSRGASSAASPPLHADLAAIFCLIRNLRAVTLQVGFSPGRSGPRGIDPVEKLSGALLAEFARLGPETWIMGAPLSKRLVAAGAVWWPEIQRKLQSLRGEICGATRSREDDFGSFALNLLTDIDSLYWLLLGERRLLDSLPAVRDHCLPEPHEYFDSFHATPRSTSPAVVDNNAGANVYEVYLSAREAEMRGRLQPTIEHLCHREGFVDQKTSPHSVTMRGTDPKLPPTLVRFLDDSVRDWACRYYGFAVPGAVTNPSPVPAGTLSRGRARGSRGPSAGTAWLHPLVTLLHDRLGVKRILEVGCGTGYWSSWLAEQRAGEHGAELFSVMATDVTVSGRTDVLSDKSKNRPRGGQEKWNDYHGDMPCWDSRERPVLVSSTALSRFTADAVSRPAELPAATALSRFAADAVLLCYAPPDGKLALEVLRHRSSPPYLILVGEFQGDTGSLSFERELFRVFELVEKVSLLNFPHTVYSATVWRRRGPRGDGGGNTTSAAQVKSAKNSNTSITWSPTWAEGTRRIQPPGGDTTTSSCLLPWAECVVCNASQSRGVGPFWRDRITREVVVCDQCLERSYGGGRRPENEKDPVLEALRRAVRRKLFLGSSFGVGCFCDSGGKMKARGVLWKALKT